MSFRDVFLFWVSVVVSTTTNQNQSWISECFRFEKFGNCELGWILNLRRLIACFCLFVTVSSTLESRDLIFRAMGSEVRQKCVRSDWEVAVTCQHVSPTSALT